MQRTDIADRTKDLWLARMRKPQCEKPDNFAGEVMSTQKKAFRFGKSMGRACCGQTGMFCGREEHGRQMFFERMGVFYG